MNNKPVYLTAEGLQKLKSELQHLITSERPRVAARIHDAKMDGDITENAEYEDAKQEQSFLEGRIGFLDIASAVEDVLARVDGSPARDLDELIDADRRARELVPLPA